MKITDKDRELAGELVELLTGDTNERDVKCVAIVLAAHRLTEPDDGPSYRCTVCHPLALEAS